MAPANKKEGAIFSCMKSICFANRLFIFVRGTKPLCKSRFYAGTQMFGQLTFLNLVHMAKNEDITDTVIRYKDRLTRFGYADISKNTFAVTA